MLFLYVIILLSFFSIYSNTIYSQQQNFNGVYHNSSKGRISINDRYFIYLNSSEDTLAICKYKLLDKNYIEINSSDPYKEARQGSNVKELSRNLNNDSVRLTFDIPHYDLNTDSLIINISFGEDYFSVFSSFNFNYSKCNKSITIGRPFRHHNCYISIYKPFSSKEVKDNKYGSYYGILLLDNLLELTLNGYNDDYEIYLPSISKSFFNHYYIEGEIIRIYNGTINWRGSKWAKNNNTNGINSLNRPQKESNYLTSIYKTRGNDAEAIRLSDSLFIYSIGEDTIAKCHLSQADRGFFEIFSDNPCKRALFNSSIKKIKGIIDSSHINFSFLMPNYHNGELLITISFTDSLIHVDNQQFIFNYSQDNNYICIPRDKLFNSFPKKCYISISLPEDDYFFSNIYGSIYGIRYINNFLEIILNGYNDNYEITLPAISEDFFSRNNIEGEYFLKRKNMILWRRHVWKSHKIIH